MREKKSIERSVTKRCMGEERKRGIHTISYCQRCIGQRKCSITRNIKTVNSHLDIIDIENDVLRCGHLNRRRFIGDYSFLPYKGIGKITANIAA